MEGLINSSELIYSGQTISIYCVGFDGHSKVKDFFDDLSAKDRKRIFTIFKLLDVKRGMLSNKEKFRDLKLKVGHTKLLEIKSYQVRIGCFWGRKYQLLLAHGFVKKRDKWPQREIENLKSVVKRFHQEF